MYITWNILWKKHLSAICVLMDNLLLPHIYRHTEANNRRAASSFNRNYVASQSEVSKSAYIVHNIVAPVLFFTNIYIYIYKWINFISMWHVSFVSLWVVINQPQRARWWCVACQAITSNKTSLIRQHTARPVCVLINLLAQIQLPIYYICSRPTSRI